MSLAFGSALTSSPAPQLRADICIDDVFEAQARETPDATAVSFGPERLTYRELDARANQLAHYLVKHGVGPEIPVALYLERSINMVVAILGVLKAGGAYVPIDLAYPKDRLSFMLRDTEAPMLLTEEVLRPMLPAYEQKVLCLDGEREKLALEPPAAPVRNTTSSNAAYIIYTSGST